MKFEPFFLMRILQFLVAAFVCLPWLHAQDKGRAIKVRTLCFEMVPQAPRDVVVSGDPTLANREDVALSRRLSSEQTNLLLTGNTVRLGEMGTTDDGKPVLNAMAEAKLPSTGSEFLLLLVPSGEKEGEVYRCLVLPDEAKAFPAGAFRFVNLSPSRLRFALGARPIEVGPGAVKVMDEIGGVREDGRFPYVAQHHEGGVWNRLSTGYWTSHENTRSLQVVYLDPRTKRLTLRGFDDKLLMRDRS